MSSHLPICGHLLFPQVQQYPMSSTWASQGMHSFAQLFDVPSGTPLSTSQILHLYGLPTHHLLHMHQARSFVPSMCPPRGVCLKTSLLDTILEQNCHKISNIYKPLNSLYITPAHSVTSTAWNKDLQSPEVHTTILAGYKTMCTYVTNEFWHEQQFKILHQAYIPHLKSKEPPDHSH